MNSEYRPEVRLLVSSLVSFLFFLLFQGQWAWVPVYHDALLHWDAARTLAEHPWFPFLESLDTGHPPLVSWLLSLFYAVGSPSFTLMHVLSWLAGGLFVGSFFATAERLFARPVALVLSGLLFLHPVVFAQALQFNLDLYLSAFIWLAIWGAVAGRSWGVALGLSLAALSKLNGILAAGPFLLLALLIAWRGRKFMTRREVVALLWPPLIPFLVLAIYLGAKFLVVGRFFDSGEFEDGEQLKFVSDLGSFFSLSLYSFRQAVWYQNGISELVIWALILGLPVVFRKGIAGCCRSVAEGLGSSIPWSQPLRSGDLALLLVVGFAAQILTQSLRDVPTLTRYFMMTYPICFLAAGCLMMNYKGKERAVILFFFALPMAGLFWIKGTPERVSLLPESLRSYLAFPPLDDPHNGEGNLSFITQIELWSESAAYISERYPHGADIEAYWPLPIYYEYPELGVTDRNLINRQGPYLLVDFGNGAIEKPHGVVTDSKRVTRFERGEWWLWVVEFSH